ncbi:helix-turn-helix transcriptional regulator [Haliscomenobacter sp.]|uniref:Helix-turn-helix domain protein n=2 Tax=Haliscomenobacter TaxID=2349 RepID=F4KZB8_HALH1|nr:helix-turn-helix transcriptional regulator [Haliscomenobacter sp.]AEE48413.1 helix-turn-helix domain protein [Haliscomenobacter hydrossis DSM 1100]
MAKILSKMNFGLSKKPADYLQEIAKRHKVLRKQAGFSQSELAKRSGVSLGSLKRFETIGQISLESLLLLADVLNRLDDFDAVLKPIENLETIEKLFSDKTRG